MMPRRPDTAPSTGRGVPGPGTYVPSLSDKNQAPKYGFGSAVKTSKLNKDKVNTPGAGSYNPTTSQVLKKNANYGMGTGKRRPLSAANRNPGPGMYRPRSSFDGPKYGMQGRKTAKDSQKVPGPGSYTPHETLTTGAAPKYGMGTSPKISKDKTTKRIVPGPGAYRTQDRPASAKAAPSWGFGTDKRVKTKKTEVPGPGQYRVPVKVLDVPRYVLPS